MDSRFRGNDVTRYFPIVLMLMVSSCVTEDVPLVKKGTLSGNVVSELPGDAWLFLFDPEKGPPADVSSPKYVTAASAVRRESGDAHFVFAEVNANPYRLWGFLDTNRNFKSDVDVLAQPGFGDRLFAGAEVNVQPGAAMSIDVPMVQQVLSEPPAFRIVGVTTDLALDAPMGGITTFAIETAPIPELDPKHTAFTIALVDANHDGRPDDVDGDGVPDVSLTAILLWKPKPGQLPEGSQVIVPIAFDVTPFLSALNGRLDTSVTTNSLTLYVVPQAVERLTDAAGKTVTRAWGNPPAGSYDLVLLTPGGQYWRMPNQLSASDATQGVIFHFDRAR